MAASDINPTNSVDNTFNTISSSNPFASSTTIPGGGINPFAGEGGSQLQQLIFNRLKLVLGDNFFNDTNNALTPGGTNPFSGGASNPFSGDGSNPIAGAGSLLQQSPFDPLKEVLGNNNPFASAGSPPFNEGNAPIGNGNRNFGSNNATIGNFNSDYGSSNAIIGNGNWNFNNNNAIIGNGNWLFAGGNTIVGNGNWFWDDGSNNATLGNGNWHFGSDNATIGNGNWDFGTNNTIIGNGNWIFSSDNTVVGNGNWLVDTNNTSIGIGDDTSSSELFPQGIKSDVNNLINSLTGAIGQEFTVLTGNLGVSEIETLNRLILSKSDGSSFSDLSPNIGQLLASVGSLQGNAGYPPVQNPEPVPEPSHLGSLLVVGLLYLLLSKFKKGAGKTISL